MIRQSPSTRNMHIPAYGFRLTELAIPWYLSGGAANCVAAYQPKGAASLAASYINLNTPGTNNAQVGSAPTWNATDGWIFDGIGQYLYTVSINGGGYTVILRFTVASAIEATANRLVGVAVGTDSNPRLFMLANWPFGGNTTVTYCNGGSEAINTGVISGATICIAGNKCYRNGVDEGVTLGAWSGTNNNPLGVGAQKKDVGANFFRACKVQALAIYSSAQSASIVAALTAAIQAL